ncbi:hypothetical protein JKP88DRAFT_243820 [Tribonema minus]|uniref:Uncharacterized protein n=1 Tax=Tribonema minus TaxID=303371 RepID=A0A835Z790_9STRA|nr:hypothetical protein JKP88DRAFT_243820 [Tribonema minus]
MTVEACKTTDVTPVVNMPAATTCVWSTKPSLMCVEDVEIEDIPALVHMADMEAARAKRRAEDERTITKRPAAAAKGQCAKKVRKESVASAATIASGAGGDGALPHLERFEALEVVKGDRPMSRCFLLSPATEELACAIFESDDTIHYVGKYGTYVLVRYSKSQGIAARENDFSSRGVVSIAPKESSVKKLIKDITWQLLLKRDCHFPVEPTPLANYINFFHAGRWRSQHVVLYVIDAIISSMKGHSLQRRHAFILMDVLRKFLAAFHATNCMCSCRQGCNSILMLNGVSGISPDRKHDNLGYGNALQVLTLVDKRHNTHIKSDTKPTVRSKPTSWLRLTTDNTFHSYRDRLERLSNKKSKNEVEVAELERYEHEKRMEHLRSQCEARGLDAPAEDLAQIAAFDGDDRYHSRESIGRMLVTLRDTTTCCAKDTCGRQICYGDNGDNDRMTLAHVPTRASPDRLCNSLGYLGNTSLVCSSCNMSEREYSRVHDDRTRSTKSSTYKLSDYKGRCITYLEGLIEIEASGDTDKQKAARKKELRQRIIAMSE